MSTSDRPLSLRKNSIYNFTGSILPVAVGLITIPQLIAHIGLERFGLLTIVWAIIGYFSLFDFGLSRTITVKLAQLSAKQRESEMNVVFWTAMKLIFIVTLVGSALLLLVSFQTFLFERQFQSTLLEEGILSVKIMALTLPAITLTAGIKGALEAEHQFFSLNLLQAIMGTLNFLVPLLVAIKWPSLPPIVISLAILRYIFLVIHFLLLRRNKWLRGMHFLSLKDSVPLFVSGGWFTVTNIISPIMVYFDRFVLAFLLPSASLAYYTTSSEIVNRLQIFPYSISRAVFPSLASFEDESQIKALYSKAFKMIALICGCISLVGMIAGKLGLSIWLGDDFSSHAYPVLLILLFGFFMNSLAWSPFSLIQALERADLSAKAHLIELPFYCLTLYFLTKAYGIQGAALAWTLRTTLDFAIMTFLADRLRRSKAPIK